MSNSFDVSARSQTRHMAIMRRVSAPRRARSYEPTPETMTADQSPVSGDLVDVVERVFGLEFEEAVTASGNDVWRLSWTANYAINGLDHTSATVKEDAALHFLTFHGVTMGDILDPDQVVVSAIKAGARIFEDVDGYHRISDEINQRAFHNRTRFEVALAYNEAVRYREARNPLLAPVPPIVFEEIAKEVTKNCGNCRWNEKNKCNWPIELLPVAYRGAFNGFSAKVYENDGKDCLEFEEKRSA